MMKRKLSWLALSLSLCLALSACAGQPKSGAQSGAGSVSAPAATPVELTVFAAASMNETLTEIAGLYKEKAPEVELVYNFDSSGTLKTQIQEGAVSDVFISAGQKQMDQLDKASDAAVNTEGLDFVLDGTRIDLLQNKVVMIVPKDSGSSIASFEDAASDKISRIALGNADVPVGQYSEQIFTSMGLWDQLNAAGKITFGTNVKEVVAQVEAAAVDCGVVYKTDAAASDKVSVVAEAPADSYAPAIYPAAVLKNSEHAQQAKDFLAFLQSDACAQIFKDAGFDVK